MAINESNQRLQYGGFKFGAAFYGWLVATAISALLTALLSAAGVAVALTQSTQSLSNNAQTVGLVSAILLLISLALAYYAGGYVAGRMSRFDGGRQGIGVWIMGLIIALVLALAGVLLGTSFNLLQQLNLPHIPVNQGALTIGGSLTLLLSLAVTLIAAISGAKVGENYHRKVDRAGLIGDNEQTRESRAYARRDTQPTFGERIENHRDRR